jgi:hypothetical protein
MYADEVAKGVADAAHRVEHMHRSLRDVRDLLPAHRPQLGRRKGERVEPAVAEVVGDRSTQDRERRRHHTKQDFEQRGLAAARFAGDAVDLVLADGERDAVDRLDRSPHTVGFGDVIRAQILDFG